ncbi:MAG: MoaD/ThiS family protein [Gammaproteobacteria bacterium]|nr:MoaD/ThiS family protein [Gammaproteobacteria bacterium]
MTIQVRFFARLREQLGMAETVVSASQAHTVGDVWLYCVGQTYPRHNVLCAINLEYVGFDDPVKDGDEVAFFPPVTGG